MNRDMLSRRLVKRGFDVVTAEDGLQGVDVASRDLPDLVLMDMSLPGIDGWEATRRLKADAATAAIPVIALTAHAMAEDRARALAAGCDDFDTKPVDLARLLDKMDRLLHPADPAPAEAESPSPPPAHASISLSAVSASLAAFKTELEHFCMQAGITAAVQEDLQVVLDEVCANVFKHAYPPGQVGALRLDLRYAPEALTLVFTDQGKPFNPLAKAAPDLSLPWQAKPIGGLGIHLVQSLTEHQHYTHSPELGNQLSLVKHLL